MIIKTIIRGMAASVIIVGTYIGYDYVRYISAPRNTIKKVAIVVEDIASYPAREALTRAVQEVAAEHGSISTTVIDIMHQGLSLISGDDSPAQKPLDRPAVKNWSKLIAESDAIIFIVPNYNNGYSAALKNSIDLLWEDWFNKPTALIAYSNVQQDSAAMMHSFKRVLHKIKSDPIATSVFVAPALLKELTEQSGRAALHDQLVPLVNEIFTGTLERNYTKQLYRATSNKVLGSIIKFFKKNRKK